ncbi:hypothetical protein QYE76_029550 [Lolium multiflorum]|uniref:Uncharacterized protein n=1 Tax=Lolium multiflorum TaxID=4521 RepID=A0AAD8QQN0_LOLMU|nr:hypothetical protein QYE76_029550 [Lolium multiflorum]
MWQFFFRVKKETKDIAMVNCGSMTFMLRPVRMYPPHSSHESVRYWNVGWFYVKNIKVPGVHDGLPKFVNEPREELDSWSLIPALAQYPELNRRRVTLGLADDVQVGKEKIAELEKQLAEAQNASTSLATASSELENLRSAYQDLETKLAEADKKRERAEKQLTEKNSELLQKE